MDEIRLRGLRFFAHHGVYQEETEQGQNFALNVTLFCDTRKAGLSDCLNETVNYAELAHFIVTFLQENTYQLIEAAAEHAAKAVLLRYPLIPELELELCKPEAPVGLPFDNVSVCIRRGWHKVLIALGSNMGDKAGYLNQGIRALQEIPEIYIGKISHFLVTKPYGGVEQDDFLNAVLSAETLFSPHELLDQLHTIEAEADRKRLIHWGPRTLDLDILAYDKLILDDEDLVIPHPDMQNRDFVLNPLSEICPNWRHPILNRTAKQLAEELKDRVT